MTRVIENAKHVYVFDCIAAGAHHQSQLPHTYFKNSVGVVVGSIPHGTDAAAAMSAANRQKRIVAHVASKVTPEQCVLNLAHMKTEYAQRDVLVHLVEPGVGYEHTHAGVHVCVKSSQYRTLCVYGPVVDCTFLRPVGQCNLLIRVAGHIHDALPSGLHPTN